MGYRLLCLAVRVLMKIMKHILCRASFDAVINCAGKLLRRETQSHRYRTLDGGRREEPANLAPELKHARVRTLSFAELAQAVETASDTRQRTWEAAGRGSR